MIQISRITQLSKVKAVTK